MKKFTLFILMMASSSWIVLAQKTTVQLFNPPKLVKSILTDYTEFTDNFESGISNWTPTNSWGLSTTKAYSPTHSLSESPTGNYTNNQPS